MEQNDHYRVHIQNIRAYVVSIVILIFLLSSCATDTGKHTMSSTTLTEQDKGKTITVHQGDQVIISLKENPTTGYQWTIDKGDNALLTLNTTQTGYTPSPGGAVGGGGRHIFVFDAKEPGTVHLQLKLYRTWEGDSSVRDRFDVVIQIQR